MTFMTLSQRMLLLTLIILFATACSSAEGDVETLPTLAVLPTETATPLPTATTEPVVAVDEDTVAAAEEDETQDEPVQDATDAEEGETAAETSDDETTSDTGVEPMEDVVMSQPATATDAPAGSNAPLATSLPATSVPLGDDVVSERDISRVTLNVTGTGERITVENAFDTNRPFSVELPQGWQAERGAILSTSDNGGASVTLNPALDSFNNLELLDAAQEFEDAVGSTSTDFELVVVNDRDIVVARTATANSNYYTKDSDGDLAIFLLQTNSEAILPLNDAVLFMAANVEME